MHHVIVVSTGFYLMSVDKSYAVCIRTISQVAQTVNTSFHVIYMQTHCIGSVVSKVASPKKSDLLMCLWVRC